MRSPSARRILSRVGAERGSALITMVLVTMVISALATITLVSATSTLNQSGNRKRWEQAFHLAEAGASRGLSYVTSDPAYTTDPSLVLPPSPDRAWVESVAAVSPVPPEPAREGEMVWVVPKSAGVVFGVGYVPSRANPLQVRAVRVDYQLVPGSGPTALLTKGDLTVGGSAVVTGTGAKVHSNGNLSVSGNAEVDGDATATGTYSQGGSADVKGRSGGGFPEESLPSVNPGDYRGLTDYDLCPDGLIRAGGAGVTTPCTGLLQGSGLTGWNGWRFQASKWRANCRTLAASSVNGKGFYVYQQDVDITCPASSSYVWTTTLVTEAAGLPGALLNGDITASGNSSIQAAREGVAFVAQRDIRLSGGTALQVRGLVLAGEQVDLAGATSVVGSVAAAGAANSFGSAVGSNSVNGNFQLHAVVAAPDVQGGVKPVIWREL